MKIIDLTRGKAIALVWGLGFAIILLGLLFLSWDPEWTSWKGFEGKMLFGHWFMLIGFAVAITVSIVKAIQGLLPDKAEAIPSSATSRTRSLTTEKVADWLDETATWNRAAIFGLGGLVLFVFLPWILPVYADIIEPIAAIPTLFGGLLAIHRIGQRKN